MALTIAGITLIADPINPRLDSAATKLSSAAVALLIPTWALLIIQSQVLIIKYLIARDELTCGIVNDTESV